MWECGAVLPPTATSLNTVLGFSMTGTLYSSRNFNRNHETLSLETIKKKLYFLTTFHANTSVPRTTTRYGFQQCHDHVTGMH